MRVIGLQIKRMDMVNKELCIGIYYYNNGDKYDGEWKDDKMNGKGK